MTQQLMQRFQPSAMRAENWELLTSQDVKYTPHVNHAQCA
jgi:hypothetical protein